MRPIDRFPTAAVTLPSFLDLPRERVLSEMLGVTFELANRCRLVRLDSQVALDAVEDARCGIAVLWAHGATGPAA